MERRLLVLVAAAGLLAGCASGGSLAKAHGPVFALNSGRWQPTEADYRIGPHPKLPSVPAVSVTKTEKAPKRRRATAHVGPVRTSPQNLTAILANGEPGALGEGGHRHMKAIYVPPLPELASVKAYRAPAPVTVAMPVPPPPPPLPSWTLAAGRPIGRQLAVWAQRAGWAVEWEVGKDWTAPRETTVRGQFWTKAPPHGVAGTVISEIATQLVEQGRRPIKARFYSGNKTLVVKRAGGNNS